MTSFDCTRLLLQWNGQAALDGEGQPWRAGPFLAMHVATSLLLTSQEEQRRATVLAIRLHREESVDLSAADAALLGRVIAAAPELHPWLRTVLTWMVDPGELAEREREALEGLYAQHAAVANPPGNGVSAQVGANGSARTARRRGKGA